MRKYFAILLGVLLHGSCYSQATVDFTSSNLPIIVIDTHGQTIVDDPKISAHMGIIDNGAGNRNNVTDPFNNFDGAIGIEIRGSSSQQFPKKQYGIELQDANGDGIDKSLLGMPKKDDWILYAAYDDKSLMRDELAYHMGRQLGRYASRARYAEVVLNGKYVGVYVLLEKIKRDKNRVNIAKLDATGTSGDALTGGYIIKIDKTTGSGGDGWTSPFAPVGARNGQTIYFLYDYPKEEDITPEQAGYIRQYVTDFETALHGDQFRDTTSGYAHYADRDSFIDYFIMNEVTKNVDGYRLSTFMHKKRDSDGGKLFMGPIWDYNEGFGNADYCTRGTTDGFVVDFNTLCPDDYWLTPFWWKRLLTDQTFQERLKTRWQSLRAGPFATANVLAHIDSVANVLDVEAQQRNFQCWPILGVYVWPNYYVGVSYQNEINWLKNWVTDRMTWLDANMPTVVTGIESPQELPLRVFPNPVQNDLYLEFEADSSAPLDVEISDMVGKKMIATQIAVRGAGMQSVATPVSALSPGVYLLKAVQRNKQTVQRIVKR